MAQEPDPALQISLVTYNAHLLPAVAQVFVGHRSQSAYRAREIGRRLSGIDIVGLCEVFDKAKREALVNSLSKSQAIDYFRLQGPQRSGRHLINGGLLFLSRFPIVASHEHTYRHASRLLTHGFKSDGYAAKGILHARVQRTDSWELDFFLTHLESQNQEQRQGQVHEMCDFIATNRNRDSHAFLLGDLNIDATSPEYQNSIHRLRDLGCEVIDLHANCEQGTTESLDLAANPRLDFILWLKPQPDSTTLQGTAATIEPLLDPKVAEGSLSDHSAVTANFSTNSNRKTKN